MDTKTEEPGLVTLMAEGMQLLLVDDKAVSEALNFLVGDAPKVPGAPVYEALRWVPGNQAPRDDKTVLMQVHHPEDGDAPFAFQGWWDGQDWRYAASGAPVRGTVRFYADPKGPAL